MVAALPASATTSARGCDAVGSSDAVEQKTRCSGDSASVSAPIRTYAPSRKKAVLSATNPSSPGLAHSASLRSTSGSPFAMASPRLIARNPFENDRGEESASEKRPSTNTRLVQPSGRIAVSRSCARALSVAAAASSAPPPSRKLADAIGPTFVYFHFSLPLRAVGMPVSWNRRQAASRSSRTHCGWASTLKAA